MKLSAILVSVNIVAALPATARCLEPAVSDKADWLKQSLTALSQAHKVNSRKMSLSDINTGAAGKSRRLRPFVAHRKLPTNEELRFAMAPRLSALKEPPGKPCQQHDLNDLNNDLNKDSLGRKASTWDGQPSQYSRIPLPLAAQAIPDLNAASRITRKSRLGQNMPGQNTQGSSTPEHSMFGQNMLGQLVQAPVVTAGEEQRLNVLMDLNQPGHESFVDQGFRQYLSGQQGLSANPEPGAGPPPFPLNLLPEGALKELFAHKSPRINAPPCYFGSWHDNSSPINLPHACFQSNISSRRPAGWQQYAPRTDKNINSPGRKRRYDRQYQRAISYGTAISSCKAPEIAMYPPYGQ